MLQDMAMDRVEAGEAFEARDDPGHVAGIGADGVLPSLLFEARQNRGFEMRTSVLRFRTVGAGALLAGLCLMSLTQTRSRKEEEGSKVRCANLIYAVNKSSVCFIRTDSRFAQVKLESNDLYQFPLSIMTGEGGFTLTPEERIQLKYYVTHGGFLLASAGCSDPAWSRSFEDEMNRILPGQKMKSVPLTRPIYHTIYKVDSVETSHDNKKTDLQGLAYNGKLVVLFSPDGLNDTAHAKNCCCGGGDEVGQAEYMNVNVLAYALLH
jgi:hypothetical protein